jgi:hypothetical protein
MPILPCVQKYHGFEFDCATCSSKYHPNITNIYSFTRAYVDAFYLQLYKQSAIFQDDSFVEDASWFAVFSDKKLIPWFSNICHYFLVKNEKYYINDFEYRQQFDQFVQEVNLGQMQVSMILKDRVILEIDRAIFIKIPFLNAGHSFCNIINAIYKIKHNPALENYTVIITQELVDFSLFLTSIIYMFFNNVVAINDNTTVKFKSAYIIRDYSIKHAPSITYLIEHLKSTICINPPAQCDNICLIKTPITKSGNNNRFFNSAYNEHIRSYGFMIVIPENYNITELFRIIYGAKRVIMSWGCCSYLNSTFVNPEASVLILGHNEYKYEYDQFPGDQIYDTDWFPVKCRAKLRALYMESELTPQMKKILDEKIRSLFI